MAEVWADRILREIIAALSLAKVAAMVELTTPQLLHGGSLISVQPSGGEGAAEIQVEVAGPNALVLTVGQGLRFEMEGEASSKTTIAMILSCVRGELVERQSYTRAGGLARLKGSLGVGQDIQHASVRDMTQNQFFTRQRTRQYTAYPPGDPVLLGVQ